SAMPRAHAQLPYARSVSTASLASWGVGIGAHEESTTAKTLNAIRPVVTKASGPVGSLDMSAPVDDNYGVILQVDNHGVNLENGGDDVCTTQDQDRPKDRGGANRRHQGRGDRRADAGGGPVLLQDTGRRPEDRVHHQLGRRCVRLHAKPRAPGSADRAADR